MNKFLEELRRALKHSSKHSLILVVQFVSTIFVARALGASALGELALLQAIALLLSPVIRMGTEGSLNAELCKHREAPYPWVMAANKLSVTISLIATTAIIALWATPLTNLAITQYLPSYWALCIILISISPAIEKRGANQLLVTHCLKKKLNAEVFTSFLGALLRILITLATESKEKIIIAIFVSYLLEAFVRRLTNTYLERSLDFGAEEKKVNTIELNQAFKKLLWDGISHFPNNWAGQLNNAASKFLLNQHGTNTVGNYDVAQKQLMIFGMANQVYYEREMANPKWKKALVYGLVTCALSVTSAPLIPLFFGNEFKEAILFSWILTLPRMLQIIGGSLQTRCMLIAKISAVTKINLLCSGITLVAFLALVPSLSIFGISIALTTGTVIQIVLMRSLTKKSSPEIR